MSRAEEHGLPEIPGAERSPAERLAIQWPHLDRNLFPEGRDCYADPVRAAYVEASYADLDETFAGTASGEPVLLIGRSHDRLLPGGFGRIFALGELAGGGAGILLDFRQGQIVFPTDRYARLVRHSLTAITGYSGPDLREGALESGSVFKWEGLLPPKDDLMDRPLYAGMGTGGRRPLRLRSVDKEEIWHRTGEIAVGEEEVDALMKRTMATSGKRVRRLYDHDFSALREALAGPPGEGSAATG